MRIAVFVVFASLALSRVVSAGSTSSDRPWLGFGATAQQCEAAYGSPKVETSDPVLVHPRTRGYVKNGWLIMVGYDERDRAEQFVFSKSVPPPVKTPVLTDAEQRAILDQFKGASAWNIPHDNGNGPIWMRADGQVHASYIADQHWLVIMNAAGMDRHIKALHNEATPGNHH